jgi:hypothetical protein
MSAQARSVARAASVLRAANRPVFKAWPLQSVGAEAGGGKLL